MIRLTKLNFKLGVPVMAQQKWIWLVSMRTQFQSLALLIGLRIQCCHELWCRLQIWLGSALLWLWHRPAVATPINPYLGNFHMMPNSHQTCNTSTSTFCSPLPFSGSSQARGKSELQLLAYATATAMRDPGYLRDLHHSSRQCQIFNPVSKARDWTCIFMDTNQVCYSWATMWAPLHHFIKFEWEWRVRPRKLFCMEVRRKGKINAPCNI